MIMNHKAVRGRYERTSFVSKSGYEVDVHSDYWKLSKDIGFFLDTLPHGWIIISSAYLSRFWLFMERPALRGTRWRCAADSSFILNQRMPFHSLVRNQLFPIAHR